MSLTREDVLAALARIVDPASGRDLVAADLIRALVVEGGKVRFVIEVADAAAGKAMEPVRAVAVAAVEALAGAGNVSALVTAHTAPKTPPDLKIGRHPTPQAGPAEGARASKAIIGVASGKGGVGKSTVAANLAVALAPDGKAVGMLDADIHGPSQPRMLGVSGRPASPDGKTIVPLKGHGVTLMSIGLMLPEGEAVVWRGPMLMGALQQMLDQVAWGELDVLIVDLPPGTGDVQMTLAQKAEVTGVIVVSTPQDVALIDARKALEHVRQDAYEGARDDREHVDLHLPELRRRGAYLRPRRRPRRCPAARPAVPGRNSPDAGHPRNLGRRHADRDRPPRQRRGGGIPRRLRGR